jgi:23S rRNA pseudouridine1911/1915/1917 synthase
VNGAAAKPSRPLKEGDSLEVVWTDEAPISMEAEDIPLSIVYEDERVLVIDKAQGMVTHPGAGNRRGTLANAVLHIVRMGRALRPEPARAGIVHRLDKDTSGLIIVAKDLEAQVFLAEQFKGRLARKEYLGILRGLPVPASGRIADRLGRDRRDRKRFASVEEGGKAAVTDYRVLASWSAAGSGAAGSGSVKPEIGDPIYGRKDGRFPEATLMLHAYRLRIALPGAKDPSLFRAPVPPRFKEMLLALTRVFGQGFRP